MNERAEERFDLYPKRGAGDAAYGFAEMLAWLVNERGIEPYVLVLDKSKHRDRTFSREDFAYDHQGDVYFCRTGKMLTCNGTIESDNQLMYRASNYDREDCSLNPHCCRSEPAQKVPHSIHEGARDMARDVALTDAYQTSRRQRKKAEMLFAHLKRILGLGAYDYEGPEGLTMNSSSQPPLRTSGNWQS